MMPRNFLLAFAAVIGGLAIGALLGLATYLWTGVPIHVGGVAL